MLVVVVVVVVAVAAGVIVVVDVDAVVLIVWEVVVVLCGGDCGGCHVRVRGGGRGGCCSGVHRCVVVVLYLCLWISCRYRPSISSWGVLVVVVHSCVHRVWDPIVLLLWSMCRVRRW